jgi:uncharacterized protein YdhG (YjbR/CyaY superfamily)
MYNKSKEVDNYIDGFEGEVKAKLEEIRELIIKNAPLSKESISYKMPTYKGYGFIVFFAGFKKHVSLFPTSNAILVFEKELKDYKFSKGTIQFPISKPLPLDLIKRIVLYRVKEDNEEGILKQSNKKVNK